MQVFVTGATGYVGSAVCDALTRAGHQVFGLARTPEKAALLDARAITPVVGSLEDPATWRSAAQNAGGVVHAAAAWGPDMGRLDNLAVDALLDILAGSNRPLVYTSGVWVMGDTGGRMNGEISAIHPAKISAWRPAVEEKVLAAKESKVKGMVFRAGMVFGRGGGAVGGFFRSARSKGVVEVVGDGENYWSNVHVDDLADLYRRALENPASGELFIACAGMPQPVKRIAHAVAKAAGIDGKVAFIPVEQARATMGLLADGLALDCRAGSTKAVRFFGWPPKVPYIFDEIERGSYTVAA
ncbi:MAG: NAD-dependent epimerase/dehydratase family protein [Bryobacterales bacterium]|nr:NAD-dependent epimerase/dehydratase family protein [Bryobacterales bacterium]